MCFVALKKRKKGKLIIHISFYFEIKKVIHISTDILPIPAPRGAGRQQQCWAWCSQGFCVPVAGGNKPGQAF